MVIKKKPQKTKKHRVTLTCLHPYIYGDLSVFNKNFKFKTTVFVTFVHTIKLKN